MELIAHRGLHDPHRAENTLSALEAAFSSPDVQGFECDLRLLGDGTPVIFHDADTSRLTHLHRDLADLDAAGWATLRTEGGQPLPTLDDLLPLLREATRRPGFTVHLEVKPATAHLPLVRVVSDLLPALGPGLVLSSFDPRVLSALYPIAPHLRRALLVHREAALDALPLLPGPPCDLHLDWSWLRHEHPARSASWRAEGRAIRLWTVNSVDDTRAILDLPPDARPDALITDMPQRLAPLLRPLPTEHDR